MSPGHRKSRKSRKECIFKINWTPAPSVVFTLIWRFQDLTLTGLTLNGPLRVRQWDLLGLVRLEDRSRLETGGLVWLTLRLQCQCGDWSLPTAFSPDLRTAASQWPPSNTNNVQTSLWTWRIRVPLSPLRIRKKNQQRWQAYAPAYMLMFSILMLRSDHSELR